MSETQEKHISLKEASRISGYAPDYIGQLIRSGKLEGKQVYANVAWMTTESAIRAYVAGLAGKEAVREASHFDGGGSRFVMGKKFHTIFRGLLYAVIGLSVIFLVFLFYLFSVSIDRRIQQSSLQKIEEARRESSI